MQAEPGIERQMTSFLKVVALRIRGSLHVQLVKGVNLGVGVQLSTITQSRKKLSNPHQNVPQVGTGNERVTALRMALMYSMRLQR